MATAQKRGFRFPWGGDQHPDEQPPDETADAKPAPVDGSNDLGAGPFGLAGTADAQAARAAAQPARGAGAAAPTGEDVVEVLKRSSWPANDRRTAGPLSSDTPLASLARAAAAASAVAQRSGMAVDAAAAVPDSESEPETATEDEATAEATAEPVAEAVTEPETITVDEEIEEVSEARIAEVTKVAPAREATDMPPLESEPSTAETVRSTSRAAEAAPNRARPAERPPAPAATPRRDNPLVAGLVRAMREAAATARAEVVATFRVDAETRAEAIRTESTTATEELKKSADADIAAIKEWSRAELARVREETEGRIADRKTQLVEETEFEASGLQERLTDLQTTVEAFEADMASFFETLLAEEDPARLAGLAERMPSPPVLAGSDADEPAPEAITEAGSEDVPSAGSRSRAARQTAAEEPEPAAAEAQPGDEAASEGSGSESLDDDAAAAAEAMARVGLDDQVQLVVSGLSSVASIAAFKAALVHAAGITAVSVTAGSDGEVLYTVTHDGHVDFAGVLGAMDAFEPRIVATDGATLTVAAREPAA